MTGWTDHFVGDRMAVDRQFSERVAASEFSSQEWGTIMTAVEFDIEEPESPSRAKVVADTSKVDQVIPALEEMEQAMGAGGGASGGGSGRGNGPGLGGGDVFGSIMDKLGLGGDDAEDRAESAAALADEYAMAFQKHLKEQDKWERACEVAAGDDDSGGDPFLDADEDAEADAETDETE
jgi:hypothetical protein